MQSWTADSLRFLSMNVRILRVERVDTFVARGQRIAENVSECGKEIDMRNWKVKIGAVE